MRRILFLSLPLHLKFNNQLKLLVFQSPAETVIKVSLKYLARSMLVTDVDFKKCHQDQSIVIFCKKTVLAGKIEFNGFGAELFRGYIDFSVSKKYGNIQKNLLLLASSKFRIKYATSFLFVLRYDL